MTPNDDKAPETITSEFDAMRRVVEWYKERTGREPETTTAVEMLEALLAGRGLVMRRTWCGAQICAFQGDVRDVLK